MGPYHLQCMQASYWALTFQSTKPVSENLHYNYHDSWRLRFYHSDTTVVLKILLSYLVYQFSFSLHLRNQVSNKQAFGFCHRVSV